MKKIVIILPTYNERDNIKQLIAEIEESFTKLKGYHNSILVVDDNSPDKTAEVVKEESKKNNKISIISGKKTGLGRAYVRGMRYAIRKMNADILFEMDADLSHDPALIPLFIAQIEKGADFVIGSRYIKGGSIPKEWGIDRKIYSIIGNLIVRFGLMILRIRDWTSGYRAFKKEVFLETGGQLDKYVGYTFQVAFLHRTVQKGFKTAEIPLNFIDRIYGSSKIIPSDYIKNVIIYIIQNSSFLRFLIVGGVGFILQTIIARTLIYSQIHPGIAVGIGAEAAILSNFTFNQLWTFAHKKIKGLRKITRKFVAFNTAALGAILIQSIVVSIGTHLYGVEHWFSSMVIAIIIFVVPYSYFMYHKVIWKEKKYQPSLAYDKGNLPQK